MTSIHSGASLDANVKPVVVVVVSTQKKCGSNSFRRRASFNATATSPTLTACTHVTGLPLSRARTLRRKMRAVARISPGNFRAVSSSRDNAAEKPKVRLGRAGYKKIDQCRAIEEQDLGTAVCLCANNTPQFGLADFFRWTLFEHESACWLH